MLLPREQDDAIVDDGDPFAEVLVGDRDAASDCPGARVDLAQGRFAAQATAFVELAAGHHQPFGERTAIVGTAFDHLDAQQLDGLPRCAVVEVSTCDREVVGVVETAGVVVVVVGATVDALSVASPHATTDAVMSNASDVHDASNCSRMSRRSSHRVRRSKRGSHAGR